MYRAFSSQWMISRGLLFAAALSLAGCGQETPDGGQPSTPPKENQRTPTPTPQKTMSLEETYRSFFRGMTSDDPALQKKTLLGFVPDKADVEAVFPDHATKIWPKMEEMIAGYYGKNYQRFAEELKSKGELLEVEVIDVRTEKLPQEFDAVLKAIPSDVEVCRIVARYSKGSGGSSSYVKVNDRWVFWQEFGMMLELANLPWLRPGSGSPPGE